jgi:predicted Zn-ribbon and HTH transcriptional regulator
MVGWYAYKGDLQSIKSWMKWVIWLAFGAVIFLYLFVGDESSISMEIKNRTSIIAGMLLIPKILLFYYCSTQLDAPGSHVSKISPKYNESLANIIEKETFQIEDIFYEHALEEFNLNRRSGAWIKILAGNSGDETKSKFDYIKLRAKELSLEDRRIILRCDKCSQKIRVKNVSGMLECPACKHSWFFDKEVLGGVTSRFKEDKPKQQVGNIFMNEIKLFFNSFNMLGYFAIVIMLILIAIEFLY